MRPTILVLLLGVGGVAFAQQTPADAINGFVAALNRADAKGASSFVLGGKTGGNLSSIPKDRWPRFLVKDLKIEPTGAKATANFRIAITPPQMAPAPLSADTAQLVQKGGKWLIVPVGAAGQAKLAGVAYLLANPSTMKTTRASSQATACLMNLKQVSMAMLMNLSDSNDTFKVTGQDFRSKLRPYLRNESMFTCPLDKVNMSSYSFNSNLTGVKMSKIGDPTMTIAFYEGARGKLNFRHDGRASIAFVDGHSVLATPEMLKHYRWKP